MLEMGVPVGGERVCVEEQGLVGEVNCGRWHPVVWTPSGGRILSGEVKL